MSVELAISRIRAFASAKGWPPSRFARESGLGANSLAGMEREGWNPTADTLRKLEAVIPPGWQPGDALPAEEGEAA